MSKIYEKNFKALLEKNPPLAAQLAFVQTNSNFEVVQQGEDSINLNIIDKTKKYPVYETEPLKEIEQKQKEIKKYERYPALFFYGIGNGIFTKLLFANPAHKKVYVFEPNLEVLFIALNIVDLSEEIINSKLILMQPQEMTFAKALNIFANPEITLFSKTFELQIHSTYYEKFYSDDIIHLNKLLIRAIKQIIINAGNDTIDTLIGIEHHIQNIPEMVQNPTFRQLLKKKNSEVAVIVSTGPSLAKQLPLLKEIQDYVTIISVDASLPILAKNNIKPDFVTSLERVELTGEFFKKTPADFQKDIIMIHASLQHKNVLENSHGRKILVMRPFKYTKYFSLHNYGYLGIGMSAANMAYELAFAMGYKNIVLIGQDLAYGDEGTSHANGHVLGEKEVKFKESDEYVTRYGGEGRVRTTRVWNMFRNFFERDIEYTKEKGVKTFNATQGGARIEGSIEISFREFIDKYVEKKEKRKITLRRPPQKSIEKNLLKAYKKTVKMEEYGKKSQEKIEKTFLTVAKTIEKLEKLKTENRLEEIDFDKLLKVSKKIDKIKDLIESKQFSSMYGETVQSYLINKELDLAKIMVRPANSKLEKKAKMIEWIIEHKEWLFVLAGSINAQRIAIQRSIKQIENELKNRNLL